MDALQLKISQLESQLIQASTLEDKEALILSVVSTYSDNNMHEQAAAFLDIHLAKENYSPELLYECGLIYRQIEKDAKAAILFNAAIAYESKEPDISVAMSHYELAMLMDLEGDTASALRHYDLAIKLCDIVVASDPEDFNKICLAICLDAKGEYYMFDVDIDPQGSIEEYKVGAIHFDNLVLANAHFRESCRIYEEAVEANPGMNLSEGLSYRYTILYKNYCILLNWEKAHFYCKKCVAWLEDLCKKEPEVVKYKEQLAYALYDLAMISGKVRYMHNSKIYYEKAKEMFELLYKKKKNLKIHNKILQTAAQLDRLNRRS